LINKRHSMSTKGNSHKPLATALGGASLTAGVLEWLAILGCLAGARVLALSPLAGYATLAMFASLPIMVLGVPLGAYGAWRGCKWVGLTGVALCFLSYALGGFMLRGIVSSR